MVVVVVVMMVVWLFVGGDGKKKKKKKKLKNRTYLGSELLGVKVKERKKTKSIQTMSCSHRTRLFASANTVKDKTACLFTGLSFCQKRKA